MSSKFIDAFVKTADGGTIVRWLQKDISFVVENEEAFLPIIDVLRVSNAKSSSTERYSRTFFTQVKNVYELKDEAINMIREYRLQTAAANVVNNDTLVSEYISSIEGVASDYIYMQINQQSDNAMQYYNKENIRSVLKLVCHELIQSKNLLNGSKSVNPTKISSNVHVDMFCTGKLQQTLKISNRGQEAAVFVLCQFYKKKLTILSDNGTLVSLFKSGESNEYCCKIEQDALIPTKNGYIMMYCLFSTTASDKDIDIAFKTFYIGNYSYS